MNREQRRARAVTVKVEIPAEQYAGLQRFDGRTNASKILSIIRIANRRVDQLMAQDQAAVDAAQAPAEAPQV